MTIDSISRNTRFKCVEVRQLLSLAILVFAGCGSPSIDICAEAKKALSDEQPNVAKGMLDRLLDNQPNDEAALRLRAEIYFQQNNFDAALEDLEKLQRFNNSPEVIHLYSVVLQHAWRHEAAIEELSELVEQHPENEAYRIDLARSQYILMRFDDASNTLTHQTIQKSHDYCLLLGRVQLGMGNLEAAETSFSRAIELDNRSAQAYYQRSTVRKAQDETLLAEEDEQMAEQLDLSHAGSTKLRDIIGQFRGEVAASSKTIGSKE